MTAKLIGADALHRKLTRPTWLTGPAGAFLDAWRFFVERGAKGRAPVWRGHLRRGITSERDQAAFPLWAAVGTNVPYARPMEFGTGTQSDDPAGGGGRHWPPGQALEPWARAHGGLSGYADAAAIGRRGGLRPRRYLRDAADEAEGKIGTWLSQMARDVERRAEAT
jgi:phage gpG-like protein